MTITREQFRELAQFQDAEILCRQFLFPALHAPQQSAQGRHDSYQRSGARSCATVWRVKAEGREKESQRKNKKKGGEKSVPAPTWTAFCAWRENCAATERTARPCLPAPLKDFWREYEVPANLPGTQLFVDRHFHLKPLAHLLGASPCWAWCWSTVIARASSIFVWAS